MCARRKRQVHQNDNILQFVKYITIRPKNHLEIQKNLIEKQILVLENRMKEVQREIAILQNSINEDE